MNEQSNNYVPVQADAQNSTGVNTQALIDELLVKMHETSDPETLLAMADQLKALTEQPVSQVRTFDESELPEWAIHSEQEQEVLDNFFNSPTENEKSGSAFSIPRGQVGAGETFVANPVPAANVETAEELEPGVDSVVAVEEKPAEMPEPAPEEKPVSIPEPTSEEEPSAVMEVAEEEEPAAVLAAAEEEEPTVDSPSVAEEEFAAGFEPALEKEPTADSASDSSTESASEEDLGNAYSHIQEPPRREDFARFHCIYQSHDGQLAIYEDEEGHLTAVNTNRFV